MYSTDSCLSSAALSIPFRVQHWVKWLGDASFSSVDEASMRPLSEGMASFMSAANKNRKKGVKE